jgi:uncharacterized RmlC-like cupin family protein
MPLVTSNREFDPVEGASLANKIFPRAGSVVRLPNDVNHQPANSERRTTNIATTID